MGEGLSSEYAVAKAQMLTGAEIPDLADAYNRLSRLALEYIMLWEQGADLDPVTWGAGTEAGLAHPCCRSVAGNATTSGFVPLPRIPCTLLSWDPCHCLGFRAIALGSVHTIASGSMLLPRDPCCLGFRIVALGYVCARDPCHCLGVRALGFVPLSSFLRHRLGIRALVLLPSPSPVSLVPLTCFPEKKEDMRA
ncbi:hypothetical protein EJ110_NYTH59671 [Nymphaea thermarum]|nr:hypothetical protein EJ110_NYTH59671 [Nymphaea thermarum]